MTDPDRRIGPRHTVALVFDLAWHSAEASHQERLLAYVNLYQDDLPPALAQGLLGQAAGFVLELDLAPDQAFGPWQAELVGRIAPGHWHLADAPPRFGRFYPRQAFASLATAGGGAVARLVEVDGDGLRLDLNHPLAGHGLRLAVEVIDPDVSIRLAAPGPVDWLQRLGQGPGMQARWQGGATDFYADDPFSRPAEGPDPEFYAKPRLVPHLDAVARAHLAALHGRLLQPGGRVLDLMSSLHSHLPAGLELAGVAGLGLNVAELAANPALNERVVQDLNAEPDLPWEDGRFDAVICTSSLEYLTRPLEVLAQCRRVLRPGGLLVMSFSNRWFPPKVVRIWSELHEFERLGLALDCCLRAGGLTDLHTYSLRGWPRPADDRHFPEHKLSDPVYAVWGRKE
ncbi:MAG: methyltransferase domain-containing protein [Pseudomonadota bacterium]